MEDIEKHEVIKWLLIITSSREKKIERAMLHALEIAESGEIYYQFRTHLGFTRLWVYAGRHYQYKLDLLNNVHFGNSFFRRPKFKENGKIKFIARNTPLPGSNPKKTQSYLEIEYVR